jgi:hypothetical protein
MLERCSIEEEGKLEHKKINHLHTRRRKRRGFKLNANMDISTWEILYWI